MVPALNPTGQDSPRTGVPAYLRGEILTPLPGDGPSLCDPLTGARRGGGGAGRSMRQNRDLRRPDNGRGCRHVPLAFAGSGLPRRKARARPGKPSPSASVTHLALSRSCPSPAAAVSRSASLRRFAPTQLRVAVCSTLARSIAFASRRGIEDVSNVSGDGGTLVGSRARPQVSGKALTFGVCHAPCFKSVLLVPGCGCRFPSRVRVWPLPPIHK